MKNLPKNENQYFIKKLGFFEVYLRHNMSFKDMTFPPHGQKVLRKYWIGFIGVHLAEFRLSFSVCRFRNVTGFWPGLTLHENFKSTVI